MRVVVTGGAGFIGKHLVAALVARGDDVVVLDNLRRARREAVHPGATFIEGDIRDPETVARAFDGAARVFHLAAQSNVMGALSDARYSFTTNVVGTFHVLEAATAAGVERVVFSSSREVYGEPGAVPVCEDAPLLAKNPYGASKLAGEAYCRTWHCAGTGVNILRFANVYGPGDTGRVIPLWIERAAAGLPLEVFGGEQVIDFVPVKLAVRALLGAAERDLGEPVNIGSGQGTTLLGLAARVRALYPRCPSVEIRPARSAEVVRFVADVGRMREVLGIEPPDDPLAGLADLAAKQANAA
ncbi:MAG: SDR family NAD(P)-dependent oxidoreductase [Dehalococcoidia bacterium]|nr:SDR family NAD(P)-dependent oxidoreductase [Dehalococcoidia bacterium]